MTKWTKNKAITCDNWIGKQRQNPKWTKKLRIDWSCLFLLRL